MTTTYDLLVASGRILDELHDSSGIMSDETVAYLDAWLEASDDKIGACLAVVRRMGAEGDLLREEEGRLRARRVTAERVSELIKLRATALLEAREALGEEPKVKTTTYTAWLAETSSIVGPEDVSEWPEVWRRVKTEPDRAAALKAAKAGEALPSGFRLESKRGVRWR